MNNTHLYRLPETGRLNKRRLESSVMPVPAVLAFGKLFYPETEKSKTKAEVILVPKGSPNLITHEIYYSFLATHLFPIQKGG